MEYNKMLLLIEQYKVMKQEVTLPLKVRLFFSALEQLINKHNQIDQSRQKFIDKTYINAFQKLADIQKVKFAHWMMKNFIKIYKQQIKETLKSLPTLPLQLDHTINHIETSCKIEVTKFGLSTWSNAKFKLDKFSRRVSVANKHRNMVLNLQQYLVRQSKKNKCTVVFQGASKKVSEQNRKVSIYFTEPIYNELQRQIFECLMQAQLTKLLHLQKSFEGQTDQKTKNNQSELIFLNSKELTSFLKYKSSVMDRLNSENLQFKSIFQKKQQGLRISKSTKTNKIFKMQFQSDLASRQLKQSILESFKTKFKYRVENTVLEQFSKKYQAVYQKYIFNDKIFDQINLREEGVYEKQDIYFSKGIDNVLIPNIIEFILIKVKPKGNGSQSNIFTSLNIPKNTPQKYLTSFLLQFHQMLARDKEQQSKLQQTMQEQFFSILSHPNDQLNTSVSIQLQELSLTKSTLSQSKDYKQPWNNKAASRIRISPQQLSSSQVKNKTVKQHYVFKQWKRAKEGGMVCVDLQLIAQQKKMIKKVIASIGNNIFKILRNGTGVVNMSLPVTIFKKQSHLQTIARNFSYAPLILDAFGHSNDVLGRFKAIIAFIISNCMLGISVKKPFNPILGQTFQCWIGGCPLYLEQISHHPPITSYYFQGRGYITYGNIQARVSFSGLNSAKVWSQKLHHIQFQDGSKICFSHPKMLIKNLIIGERQFHFADKAFVYDMKNNYFGELNFGPRRKGGFLSNSSEPQDFIFGNIFRTTTGFLSKFKSNMGEAYPSKQDIAKQICNLDGVWNQAIRFDDNQYINFSQCLPLEVEDEPHPLPSHSSNRTDIKYIGKNQIELAQEHKQKLEQIQRNDKKLRENYKK